MADPISVGAATLGAAAISGGSSLAGTLLSNQFQKHQNTLANQNNLLLNQWQFERAAQYNHPAAQMQRLREAGLNPNLVYGGNTSLPSAPNVGSISSKPVQGNAFHGIDVLQAIDAYYRFQNLEKQNQNLAEQNTILKHDADLKSSQADIARHDADLITHSPLTSSQFNSLSGGSRFLYMLMSNFFNNSERYDDGGALAREIVDGMSGGRKNWVRLPVSDIE